MRCPRCQAVEDKVIQSRASRDGASIRRRRECVHCGHRFTTYETIEENIPVVVKKDGRREAFSREKLIAGLMKACEKRTISVEQIDNLVDEIVQQVQQKYDREVPSNFVGEQVMRALNQLDPVAYVRFASVYRDFKDLTEFMDELKSLVTHKP
jgi:transcriptional repressor NrdR